MREKTPRYDYLAPMIADADAGFGGVTSAMKLTKMMIEVHKNARSKKVRPDPSLENAQL